MTQQPSTPAAFYLCSKELVKSLPFFHPGADDMCLCIAELEREAGCIYYNDRV